MVQEQWCGRRSRGECDDVVLFCEHPPTLSLGKRTLPEHVLSVRQSHPEIAIAQADRGGCATYHGPGQLIIYPVISLRERRLGVRGFVDTGLRSIESVLLALGLAASRKMDPAGVWVGGRKIASVGLRITEGITNHGFSLNVNCDLQPFSAFVPCGLTNVEMTSIVRELGGDVSVSELFSLITKIWQEEFCGDGGRSGGGRNCEDDVWRECIDVRKSTYQSALDMSKLDGGGFLPLIR